jgi:hypothetical protein
MPKQKLTMDDAFKQPGGYRQIQFGDITVVAPLTDVRRSLHLLEQMGPDQRAAIMRSVNNSITEALPAVLSGVAKQKKAIAFGQDIAIWFAYEVFNGRARLEETTH